MAESTPTRLWLWPLDSNINLSSSRVSLNSKRTEEKTMYSCMPLIIRKEYKETTIMVGAILTQTCSAIHLSSLIKGKDVISTLYITSTLWDRINCREGLPRMLKSNTGLLTKRYSNFHMPTRSLLMSAIREVLMLTLDGKWLKWRWTRLGKRLLYSDASTQAKSLRKTSSQQLSTLPVNPRLNSWAVALLTVKELLTWTHTPSSTRDSKTSSLLETALV